MPCSRLRISLCTLALALVALGPAPAQENLELGKMWTFENPPLEYLEATYGFAATQPWLDHTRLASIRFGNGCSASFVSPTGLILTNHHCVRNQIAEISPPSADWVKDGFIAGSVAEEVKIPGLTVQQLVSMADITGAMNADIVPDDDDATVNRKRETNQGRILKDAREKNPGLRPEVVKLYHGGMFQLYVYKVWDDVRLVAAPNLQTAHFGGDLDNFTYPRYCIDFSLCRAYENGKPADTSGYYFKWNSEGAKDGELVFVTGSPGSTGRMLTYDTLEYRRDAYYPVVVDYVRNRIRITEEHMARHPEKEKELRTGLLGDQNTRKAFEGYYGGLQDPELMARKKKAEARFRAKVAADPELQAKYGDAWDRMAKIAEERTELLPRLWYHSARDSGTLAVADQVLMAVAEEAPERVRAQARRRALTRPTGDPELEKEHLAAKFKAALHWLGMSDPVVRTALANRDPEEAARRIVEDSIMGDKEALKELLDSGAAAVAASTDPALEIARVIAAHGPAARERWGELEAEESVQIARIGQALFAVYGTTVSPDATFTLRLSDGVVKGYPYNGTLAPAWTTFYGLYGRATEFGNVYPFDLPQIWLDRRTKIDLATPVDFVSTNDIIGGNSGSPVIDTRPRGRRPGLRRQHRDAAATATSIATRSLAPSRSTPRRSRRRS